MSNYKDGILSLGALIPGLDACELTLHALPPLPSPLPILSVGGMSTRPVVRHGRRESTCCTHM